MPPESKSRRRSRRRSRGGAVLCCLIFLLGAGAGWIGWPFVLPSDLSAAAMPPAPPSTNSTIKDRASVLPVQARAIYTPPPSNATGTATATMMTKTGTTNGLAARPGKSVPTSLVAAESITNANPSPVRLSSATARPTLEVTNPPLSRAALGERIVEAQIGLVRRGLSPGSIDGLLGTQTRAALRVFQAREGIPLTGQLDAATLVRLAPDSPVYTNYVVTAEDLGRLLPLSTTWLGKSQQPRLDYESILELVAERTFSHPNLLRRLNPSIAWTNVAAGTELKVPASYPPEPTAKAASIQIRLADRTLQVFDSASNLLAHFPCSIAQRVEKRPVGEELHVAVVAPDPNYTLDPAVFPESVEMQELGRKLILQPGPNNPVGVVWIGLDKPGYGIHGTPRPEEVGRTESHGCFRLANWNARQLLQLVIVGTPVRVLP
jgi:lipoprotein-anchoring transpeptidase ErfK/SrfK